MYWLIKDEKSCKKLLSRCLKHPGLAKSETCTFLQGSVGVWALSAIVWHDTRYIDKILRYKSRALKMKSNEVLFGKAGYLSTLIFLRDHFKLPFEKLEKKSNPLGRSFYNDDCCGDFYNDTWLDLHKIDVRQRCGSKYAKLITRAIRRIAEAILKEGHEKKSNHLVWRWHGEEYLGAAHGTAGILSVLFSAGFQTKEMIKTLKWLSTQRLASGNYPSHTGSKRDVLVQWCHGATGIGLLFAQVSHTLSKQRQEAPYYSYTHSYEIGRKIKPLKLQAEYLALAEQCGECVYQRGFLTKGISLCHGSLGNAILFLKLYRLTHKKIWMERALHFATFILEEQNKALWKQADQPYSLANGFAGAAYFYSALTARDVNFPLI